MTAVKRPKGPSQHHNGMRLQAARTPAEIKYDTLPERKEKRGGVRCITDVITDNSRAALLGAMGFR